MERAPDVEAASEVREARRPEHPELVRTLARAFEDDPVSEFLYPDPETRIASLERSYRVIVPALCRHGALFCHADLNCAAVWQAPSPPRVRGIRQMLFNLRIVLAMGTAVRRGQVMAETMQAAHLRAPHWYLGILGTHPDHQGKGIGSRVLAPVLARCDREGHLAYLESSKESNIPFYRRHGFEVTGEIQIPDGPRLWPMTREPR